jgi:hypothetical protein
MRRDLGGPAEDRLHVWVGPAEADLAACGEGLVDFEVAVGVGWREPLHGLEGVAGCGSELDLHCLGLVAVFVWVGGGGVRRPDDQGLPFAVAEMGRESGIR